MFFNFNFTEVLTTAILDNWTYYHLQFFFTLEMCCLISFIHGSLLFFRKPFVLNDLYKGVKAPWCVLLRTKDVLSLTMARSTFSSHLWFCFQKAWSRFRLNIFKLDFLGFLLLFAIDVYNCFLKVYLKGHPKIECRSSYHVRDTMLTIIFYWKKAREIFLFEFWINSIIPCLTQNWMYQTIETVYLCP